MVKKNLLNDFTEYMISQNECNEVKGGRANTPVNTGSYGFIDWGDVGVRDSNFVGGSIAASVQIGQNVKWG